MSMGRDAAAQHTFPILQWSNIVACLAQTGIKLSLADVKDLTSEQLKFIFERFLELILGVTRDELSQPQSYEFDSPELYEDATPELVFHKAIEKLLVACGVHDFTPMCDLYKPEPKRTKRLLSAIINFLKFREEHISKYQEIMGESDKLLEKRTHLEEAHAQLSAKVADIRAARERDQPEVDALTVEVKELGENINARNIEQATIKGESNELKAQTSVLADKLADVKFRALNAKQECDALRKQIVPAPEKIKRQLKDMAETLQHDKEALQATERKSRELQVKLDSLQRVDDDVRKAIRFMEEMQVEADRLAEVQHKMETAGELKERQALRIKELQSKEQQLTRLIASNADRLIRLQKQNDLKRSATEEAIETARRDEEALRSEKNAFATKIKHNEKTVRELSAKMSAMRSAHEEQMRNVQSECDALHTQLREYHGDLLRSLTESV